MAEGARLSVELNAAEDTGGGCRLTFLADNALGADLSSLVLETVLITREGLVERLTLLDFQSLPQGRTRVRQFDLPGLACADLGRVLFNAAATCTGAGLTPDSCMAGLRPGTRLDVEVTG
jgi:hypothetical protein